MKQQSRTSGYTRHNYLMQSATTAVIICVTLAGIGATFGAVGSFAMVLSIVPRNQLDHNWLIPLVMCIHLIGWRLMFGYASYFVFDMTYHLENTQPTPDTPTPLPQVNRVYLQSNKKTSLDRELSD
jgi:hypothetical protein